MGKFLKEFQNHSDYQAFIEGGGVVKPNVSHCVQENDVHYNPIDYSQDYLTFVALEDGTISFNIWQSMGTDMITSISYSTDDGTTWTTTPNRDNKEEHLAIDVDVNAGDKVLWKGIATQTGYIDEAEGEPIGSFFSSTCEFDAKGNVMSLLYGDNFKGQTTIEKDFAFCSLFYGYNAEKTCGIVNAKDMSLPATTLAELCYYNMFRYCEGLTTAPQLPSNALASFCYGYMFYGCTSLTRAPQLSATTLSYRCYQYMFNGCTSLTTAPELPATTLAERCYASMFGGCTSLTTAPQLPATTLAEGCYNGMFYGCTSLITAPQLPATTLASVCYSSMFADCTSLTTAPQLQATTLVNGCYQAMFQGCTSLTTAPQLPATTLTKSCYSYMFYGCTNLNYIKAMFTTTPSATYTQSWVYGVAASGTFVKNSSATWNVNGINGIPTSWTVETASE